VARAQQHGAFACSSRRKKGKGREVKYNSLRQERDVGNAEGVPYQPRCVV
jgi:hypothetical protein